MQNVSYKFKTNINCGGCIKAVTQPLNQAEGISSWEVNTDNPDKILTVVSNGITREEIMAIIKKAGYNIEVINN